MSFKTLAAFVGLTALLSATSGVLAQEAPSSWPSKPIKYVVPFADRKSTRLNSSHG